MYTIHAKTQKEIKSQVLLLLNNKDSLIIELTGEHYADDFYDEDGLAIYTDTDYIKDKLIKLIMSDVKACLKDFCGSSSQYCGSVRISNHENTSSLPSDSSSIVVFNIIKN